MKRSLLANLVAYALFALALACTGMFRWELLLFQLVLQMLTNEFWYDFFVWRYVAHPIDGVGRDKRMTPARVRRYSRRTSFILLLLPAALMALMAAVNGWGEGWLSLHTHLPLNEQLFIPSLIAQSILLASTLGWGLPPLSINTIIGERKVQRDRSDEPQEKTPETGDAAAPRCPDDEILPQGLPAGVSLPDCLRAPQSRSPLHTSHAEMVRARLLEDEKAILFTAPVGMVSLPSSSNERLLGGVAFCVAALLLYAAMGLFADASARVVTRWAVLLAGLALLPVSMMVLRAAALRQAQLLVTDYILTNRRLHICREDEWEGVSLASVEVVPGGSHEGGMADIELCPDHGADTYTLVNVAHAEELCSLLEELISREQAR